ncbi:MAG: hypothetical protein COB76_02190 [Alphaproteobacteria bacterium]|nr:MAG: hypothetical protein COB76_02190 [Alphaproteobacteria bacterium]
MKINIWWKITIGFVVLVLSIVGILLFAVVSDHLSSYRGSEITELQQVITSNIRLPDGRYYDDLRRESLIDQDEWFDLEPISDEEWTEVTCKFTGKSYNSDFIFEHHYARSKSLGEEEKRYYYCISPNIGITNYITLPTNEKDYLYQSGHYYQPCIQVNFHEYILRYPKILRNILKISERPCHYLKNMHGEHCYRRGLYCDSFDEWPYKNESTCVVINIISSEGELRSQILVPRKDNNHLFNKK